MKLRIALNSTRNGTQRLLYVKQKTDLHLPSMRRRSQSQQLSRNPWRLILSRWHGCLATTILLTQDASATKTRLLAVVCRLAASCQSLKTAASAQNAAENQMTAGR